MERNNHLSESLRAYQNAKNQTLTEFSQELGIARDYDLLYRLGFTAPTVMLSILTSGDFYRSMWGGAAQNLRAQAAQTISVARCRCGSPPNTTCLREGHSLGLQLQAV